MDWERAAARFEKSSGFPFLLVPGKMCAMYHETTAKGRKRRGGLTTLLWSFLACCPLSLPLWRIYLGCHRMDDQAQFEASRENARTKEWGITASTGNCADEQQTIDEPGSFLSSPKGSYLGRAWIPVLWNRLSATAATEPLEHLLLLWPLKHCCREPPARRTYSNGVRQSAPEASWSTPLRREITRIEQRLGRVSL